MKTITKGKWWLPLLALMSFTLLVACQQSGPPELRQWEVPQVKPAPGVEEIYRANADMGISDRSFEVPSDN